MTELRESEVQKMLDDGMPQTAICEHYGVSQTYLTKWVRAHAGITIYRSKWRSPSYKALIFEAIEGSTSLSEIIRKLGGCGGPGNFRVLYDFAKENNIDLASLMWGNKKNTPKVVKDNRYLSSSYLKEGSTKSQGCLKRFILKNNIIPYVCTFCANPGEWRGSGMVLVLDHINGVNNDNRVYNLRFCCPNCNSQLPTHCGHHKHRLGRRCRTCGNVFLPKGAERRCQKCTEEKAPRDWSVFCQEVLSRLASGESYLSIGKSYGVSDNAVRKRLRLSGIVPPKKHKLGRTPGNI
jgi:hypothetical protein